MQIRSIKPTEKINELVNEIEETFKGKYETTTYKTNNSLSVTFKLLNPEFHTLRYLYSQNYTIGYFCIYTKTHKKPCKTSHECLLDDSVECKYLKPYAINNYFNVKIPIRKHKALNEKNWMEVNELLNNICDNLSVSCTIQSSLITIRRGLNNVWLTNYLNLLHKKGFKNSDDLNEFIESETNICLDFKTCELVEINGICNPNCPYERLKPQKENGKFKAIFATEKINLDKPITQKVFTDYDKLDKIAESYGYENKGNDNAYCGWIPTISDNSHSTESHVRELNKKLENAQNEGYKVAIGFCQTGNFSVGYTLYLKLNIPKNLDTTEEWFQKRYPLMR